jgi:hypothetical protein
MDKSIVKESIIEDPDMDDTDVPMLAVESLNQATIRTLQTSDIVVVRNNQLVRISPDQTVVVLKDVPGRKTVSVREKKLR